MAAPSKADASSSSSSSRPTPGCISFISSLDRATHEAYLQSRGKAYVARIYRQLVNGEDIDGSEAGSASSSSSLSSASSSSSSSSSEDEGNDRAGSGMEEDGRGTRKKRRRDNNSNNNAAPPSSPPKKRQRHRIPQMDSSFRHELVAAKPEPATLVIGDAPADVYLPSLLSLQYTGLKSEERRGVVASLEDKVQEPGARPSRALFWDLEKLPAHKVKALAEHEWAAQLDSLAALASTSGTAGSEGEKKADVQPVIKRSRQATARAQARKEEKEAELEAEIHLLQRAFCDKNRAMALRTRAAAGW